MPIAFPTLLCGIILSQYPGILVKGDIPCTRKSTLSLDYRKQMIAELKDVSNDLGEKKFKIDHVIQALELKENDEGVVGEQEEKEDEDAGSSDAGSENEIEEDSDESPSV
ncbi:hypothetical protein A2U01_0052483 [Trifolium medium]|uniref:Envelope-like protein n=1 Tax=Trifolium medium TaxID=97028 RepID=A0A392R3W6_9FABA|nr:hypothetical protein [Trifolium medium]